MSLKFDLHCHSTASDGALTPTELVTKASGLGLAVLALTDHDTVAGVDEFIAAARKAGLYPIPGVEIGADFKPGTLHLLGYSIDHHHPDLISRLAELRNKRRRRAHQILAQLQQAGIAISLDDVQSGDNDSRAIGRPHFARALVRKGYAADMHAAFHRFLTPGAPGYVSREKLSAAESIRMIRAAGGLPVLAHPKTVYPDQLSQLEPLVKELVASGLGGIEVYYPEHTPREEKLFLDLAQRHGLITTGGSDYHGPEYRAFQLGYIRADRPLPAEILESFAHWDKKLEQHYFSATDHL